ncbi:MAG: 16S rRNA (cytosine(1402)-N(4))-methyltransferase RsmH [Oscillospiraceae bacterium]|jgi:16S rRNA (cytosine1402-N4)-methyltransferase
MEFTHRPVLLQECIQGLNIKPDGVYVDGTLGGGGHSQAIAQRLESGRLIAIDRDERALERASQRLAPLMDRITMVYGNFRDLGKILDGLGIKAVDGMLFDLGVSSPQLDEAERGFSYMTDAPLDMRMDESESLTASDIVNTWPEERLKRILYDFGEERYAPKIAAAIVKRREVKKIESTLELVEVIKKAMPPSALREKQHPAKRTFQAIRIAVNDELEAISEMLETAADRLNPGGRLAVISFHSLEDRIVKNAIAARENGCTCPRDFPVCTCGFVQTLKSVTRKPIVPSEEEISVNPRARSAKLRIAERVRNSYPFWLAKGV